MSVGSVWRRTDFVTFRWKNRDALYKRSTVVLVLDTECLGFIWIHSIQAPGRRVGIGQDFHGISHFPTPTPDLVILHPSNEDVETCATRSLFTELTSREHSSEKYESVEKQFAHA